MDVAVLSEIQKVGVRAIVRDHEGKVILAASILEENVTNAMSIEAIAILIGLQIYMH